MATDFYLLFTLPFTQLMYSMWNLTPTQGDIQMSTATAAASSERIALGKLLWVGPLAIVASLIANVILRLIAVAILNPSPKFQPLASNGAIIFLTTIGTVAAVVVFAVVARCASRPLRLYQIIAGIALVISLVPDVLLLSGGAPFGGVTVPAVAAL